MSAKVSSLQRLRPEVEELKRKLDWFVENECIPAEVEYQAHMAKRYGSQRWTDEAIPPCLHRLKASAKKLRLWNLFLPPKYIEKVKIICPDLVPSIPLSYREYGILSESMGRCPDLAPQACNCSAPDTGNMEVLIEFGTRQQQEQYLIPLLKGDIRSTFLMTEPSVASSDPTNINTRLVKTINSNGIVEYELSGSKWWSTGAMDPRCRLALAVVKTDYSHPSCYSQRDITSKHELHTVVAIPMPSEGVVMKRALTVFGYDDAPFGHAEVLLNKVKLSADDVILGEGKGFLISQARLGPGRIHHCMRAIGMASRCYELMLQRAIERKTFGKYLWEHGGCQELIADSVADINAARLLTLECAALIDGVGPKEARHMIACIKIAVPRMALAVVDRAVQVFGGAGVSEDFVLARFLAMLRALRIADGPDAVHKMTLASSEIKRVGQANKSRNLQKSKL